MNASKKVQAVFLAVILAVLAVIAAAVLGNFLFGGNTESSSSLSLGPFQCSNEVTRHGYYKNSGQACFFPIQWGRQISAGYVRVFPAPGFLLDASVVIYRVSDRNK